MGSLDELPRDHLKEIRNVMKVSSNSKLTIIERDGSD